MRDKIGGKASRARRPKGSRSRTAPKVTQPQIKQARNALLRRELDEALEQQAATAEILKVISDSTFDLQAVLNTLARSAGRLCQAENVQIFLRDGEVYRLEADNGFSPEYQQYAREHPIRPGRNTLVARTSLERKTVHIHDALADPEYTYEGQKLGGYRSLLGVPLIRAGDCIGVIALTRPRVHPFSDNQIGLVINFAAQAVIAIENTRLLNELRQRTDDLSESLDQQTAASEVLKVISSSPGELEPVFQAMLENATRICDAKFGHIYRWDGDSLRLVASHNTPPAFAELRMSSPFRPSPETPTGRMVATKSVTQVADLAGERGYAERDPLFVESVEIGGIRSLLSVPMLKENKLVGAFTIYRQEVRLFSDKQIELVKNFADQAVIAIENARLLNDLNKLNHQLEQRVTDQVNEIERMGRLRRFLPPQVADLIVASGAEEQLESHRREITALFCDLRGFTGFSESSDPEDVMALLREYHAAIGGIINKYGGTLERYAGDGVMVVFNDPIPVDNPALQAVLMAIDMRAAIEVLIEKWRKLGHDIGFGIGIAHGFATLGTIGFEGRFDYAAIGTVSNVASRLCDEAKPGQILISPRVLMAVEKDITVEPVGDFALKGIRRPLTAYNVLATKVAN